MSFLNLITQSQQINTVKPDYIFSTPKHEDIDEDTIKFQRIRKVRIIQSNQDEDNEVTSNPYTQFKTVKLNDDLQSTAQKIQIPFKLNESKNKQSLRQKFGWLLPQHLKIKLGKTHLKMIECAAKIDNYLSFEKTFKNSKCGDLFQNIKKNLYANYNLVLQLSVIKKILFLDSKWYECKKEGEDIRINLPCNKIENEVRKSELRQKIVKFIKNQEEKYLQKNNLVEEVNEQGWATGFDYAQIQICQFEFEFERCRKIIRPKKTLKKQLKQENQKKIQVQKQTDQNSFKDKLFKMIAMKEQRLKKSNIEQVKQLDQSDHVKIIEELNQLYNQKNVNNIFYVNLIEIIAKRTNHNQKQIQNCITQAIAKTNYLKLIHHSKGNIVQINKQIYPEVVKFIQGIYV